MSIVGFPQNANWREAHEKLVEHKKKRAVLEYEEGELLLDAQRAAVHAHLGYATFEQYIDFLLGYSPRSTFERLRVARALRELPELTRAMREGEVSWSCVRELTRVAVTETEKKWLAAAKGRTVRQVEQLVSGHLPGDCPTDPARPEARRHVLRMEVSAETYALFREAQAKLRRDSAGRLDDDDLLMQMARQVLEGPRDEGRAGYQVAMSVCPKCNRGSVLARGEQVEVGPEVVEMASCDGQRLEEPVSAHVGGGARATQSIPPAIRRQVMRRDGGRCQVPGCQCSVYVDVHHIRLRSEGGTHDPEHMVVLCAAHHRAVHRGTLLLEGNVSGKLSFRHADGTLYGGAVSAEVAAACVEAQSALRGLGFGESQSRRAISHARQSGESGGTADELVRAALRYLRPQSCVREQRAAYHVCGPIGLGALCGAPVGQVRVTHPIAVPHTASRAVAPAWASRETVRAPFRRETGTAAWVTGAD